MPYAHFCESSSPTGILLGLYDAGAGWTPEVWCRELYPYADKNGWLLLVPQLSGEVVADEKAVLGLLEHYKDSTSSARVAWMALGSGGAVALQLAGANMPGLIVSPVQGLLLWPAGKKPETAVALAGDVGNKWLALLHDTLAVTGQWTRLYSHAEGQEYYIEDHYKVYDQLLVWADSMGSVVKDSAARGALDGKAGLVQPVPEVLKQGQQIVLKLRITQQGHYKVEVFDLSAKSVFAEKHFFGKGVHTVSIPTGAFNWGVYHVEVAGGNIKGRYKFMIRG